MKFEAKGILILLLLCTSETSAWTVTTLGGALVTLRVKLDVTLNGKSS
jgi:hypothetical protein